MKRIIKSRIFAFVLGALIFSGITGVAAYTIFADNIGYTPSDSTWKKSNGEDITNVKDAIDELYIKANTTGGNLNYDILYQKQLNASNYGTYQYTITSNDTKYKAIMVVSSSVNVSSAVSPANITVSNGNIVSIYNPSVISYKEYGSYNLTNKIYVGAISNIVVDDVISINCYVGGHILILGIK